MVCSKPNPAPTDRNVFRSTKTRIVTDPPENVLLQVLKFFFYINARFVVIVAELV